MTGRDQALAHPNLVCDVAIGQSTGPTQRVLGNLFYRGLVLLRPVSHRRHAAHANRGRRAEAEPAAGGRHRERAGGAADPDGEPARRAGARLLALPDDPAARPERPRPVTPTASTRFPTSSTPSGSRRAIPGELEARRASATRVPGAHFADLELGTTFEVEGRETVTRGARAGAAHAQPRRWRTPTPAASAHGRRLVYGGHTISVAAAQATRAIPQSGRRSSPGDGCDHLAPVFEGDVLRDRAQRRGGAAARRAAAASSDLRARVQRRPRGSGETAERCSTGASSD